MQLLKIWIRDSEFSAVNQEHFLQVLVSAIIFEFFLPLLFTSNIDLFVQIGSNEFPPTMSSFLISGTTKENNFGSKVINRWRLKF